MANDFSVNFWGSKPGTNDDCHQGTDFATREAALKAFNADAPRIAAWVELAGPGVHEERKNPAFVATPDDDSDWRAEHAMQAGMAFGCAGYNDAMGY